MLNGQRELVMALWKLGEGVEAYSMGGDDGGAVEWLVLEDGVGWVKAVGLRNVQVLESVGGRLVRTAAGAGMAATRVQA
ncbi:hypothetical protein V6N11_077501 [Hibiscus sabdariffa]|uniref:Uncharacterized protein n=1 Tax=Hibiscus sabdariffa TaxID=183260 RepID=A0ABR2TDA7_9ROSI